MKQPRFTAVDEPAEIRVNGKIAELTEAKRGFKCAECGLPIESGTRYYTVTCGGSGLASIKFPDRVHVSCIRNNLSEERRR